MSDIDKAKVLAYMEAQGRPWSAQGVTLNLHKEVGKTACEKVLEELSRGDDGEWRGAGGVVVVVVVVGAVAYLACERVVISDFSCACAAALNKGGCAGLSE